MNRWVSHGGLVFRPDFKLVLTLGRIASFRIVKVPNGFRSNTRGCYKRTPKSNSLANKAYINELQKSGCLVVKDFKSRTSLISSNVFTTRPQTLFCKYKRKKFLFEVCTCQWFLSH
jgi:hypothetical protein